MDLQSQVQDLLDLSGHVTCKSRSQNCIFVRMGVLMTFYFLNIFSIATKTV